MKNKTVQDFTLSAIPLLILFFLLAIPSSYAANSSDLQPAQELTLTTTKKVLIIYSTGIEKQKLLREGLFNRIQGEQIAKENRPEIFEEFMDNKRVRLNLADFDGVFMQYLKQKYANVKLNLVAAHISEAINFLNAHPELFPDVPRHILSNHVYSNSPSQPLLPAFFKAEQEKVFNGILQLFPTTQRIIIVKTKMKINRMNWVDLSGVNLRQKIQVELWDDFSFEELFRSAAQLPPNTVILFLHAIVDNKGQYNHEDVVATLSKASSVPVFIHVDSHLEYTDTVGGFIFSHKQLGDLFGRKLLGEEISDTPEALQAQLHGYYFNDQALKRWHIPDESLPKGSIIVGRKESILYTYRWYIAVTLFVIFSESILVGWLTRSLRTRKKLSLELVNERDYLELRVQERTMDLAVRTLQLEESRDLFRDAAKITKLGVFNFNLGTKELLWDKSMFSIYDIDPERCTFRGCNSSECSPVNCAVPLYIEWQKTVYAEDLPKIELALQSAIEQNTTFDTKFRIHRANNTTAIIQAIGQVYRDEQGKPSRLVGINQDITEREEAENIIRNLAFYDPLTHLPNRRLLAERLKQAISSHQRDNKQFAVMMMDLDKFKAVNDTFGHGAGDELLQQVAMRISDRLREHDTVARLGGDEFVVVLEAIRGNHDVAFVANALIETLTRPFALSQCDDVQISTSIGIAFYPQQGEDEYVLIDKADSALYQAKQNGRGCFVYFESQKL